jgi:hypothetical protein
MIDWTTPAANVSKFDNMFGGIFEDPRMNRWLRIVMHRFGQKFEFLGDGRHRCVYRHKNWVIKVPHNEEGVQANIDEYKLFKGMREHRIFKGNKVHKEKYGVTYARCRMLNGIFLVMEYVEDSPNLDMNKPEWSDYIDCRQVGLNRRNEFVAYDFGG